MISSTKTKTGRSTALSASMIFDLSAWYRLIAVVERAVRREQPPKEALVEADRRAVVVIDALACRHVVAGQDHDLWFAEILWQRVADRSSPLQRVPSSPRQS